MYYFGLIWPAFSRVGMGRSIKITHNHVSTFMQNQYIVQLKWTLLANKGLY